MQRKEISSQLEMDVYSQIHAQIRLILSRISTKFYCYFGDVFLRIINFYTSQSKD